MDEMVLLEGAYASLSQGERGRAVEAFSSLLSSAQQPEVFYAARLALAQLTQDDVEGLEGLLNPSSDLDSRGPDWLDARLSFLLHTARWIAASDAQSAMPRFQELEEEVRALSHPLTPFVSLERISVLVSIGADLEAAELAGKLYEEASASNAVDIGAAAAFEFGSALARTGHIEEAKHAFEGALEALEVWERSEDVRGPIDRRELQAQVVIETAWLAHDQGDEGLFETLSSFSLDQRCFAWVAALQASMRDEARAAQLLTALLERDDENPRHILRLRLLMATRQSDLRALRAALEEMSQMPGLLPSDELELGLWHVKALHGLGELEEAEQRLQVLQALPGGPAQRAELSRLQAAHAELRGELSLAIEHLGRALAWDAQAGERQALAEDHLQLASLLRKAQEAGPARDALQRARELWSLESGRVMLAIEDAAQALLVEDRERQQTVLDALLDVPVVEAGSRLMHALHVAALERRLGSLVAGPGLLRASLPSLRANALDKREAYALMAIRASGAALAPDESERLGELLAKLGVAEFDVLNALDGV